HPQIYSPSLHDALPICERAAFAGRAVQTDFTAEQRRQFARNGQTQPRAAVLAARPGVGLLERFKNQLLLLRRDPDAGVADGERKDRKSTRLNSSHVAIS